MDYESVALTISFIISFFLIDAAIYVALDIKAKYKRKKDDGKNDFIKFL